jgi:hypothetical protein
MTDNLTTWNALAKTDPKHTKSFNRAGGFKGTAIKPIWIIRRLTEQFGACGVGWGLSQPSFEVVRCEGEILVFCTVSAWHESPENKLWGVGGDKVQAKRKDGFFCDDEAFKKAFTDAVNNAFKFLGVGADVHMGLFDDDKYVAQARSEFEGANDGGGMDASLQLALDGIAACDTVLELKGWVDRNWAGVLNEHVERVEKAIADRKSKIAAMDRARAA